MQNLLRSHLRYLSNLTLKSKTEIVIPFRIERKPTDILEALATTISKDHLAPQYKYEDDPYFIPSSNISKRSYALSKESGKKAARYFLEKYPEFFKVNKSVPFIKAFDPPEQYNDENVSSVHPLQNTIKDCDVENSILVYQILKKKGIPVSQDVKLDLLELLCFFNNTQPPNENYWEERYFQRINAPSKKWNLKGMAEELFTEMDQDARAYSAMIAGASKFFDAERAHFFFQEMQGKNLKASLQAYNGLISVAHLLHEDNSTRWEFATILLSQMKVEGLQPDLFTINNLLALLCKCSRWKKTQAFALRVLSEMKILQIEPNLGVYQYLLLIFCAFDFQQASVLYEIMQHIENKEFTIQHPSDVLFFATAMEVCWKGLGDKQLAYRLHKLLEMGRNCKLLGNSLLTSQYFKSYFMSLSETEDVEKFMEVYEKYVPNTYIPEPNVIYAVIQSIHFNGAYKYLPRLCSDVLLFDQTERANILDTLLEAAGCMKQEDTLQKDIVNMVWNIVERFQTRNSKRQLPFEWTGIMLGNILKTFMNGEDFEKSWVIIKMLKEQEQSIIGYPEKDCLLNFCELSILNEKYDEAKYCIKYAINGSYPSFKEDIEVLVTKMFEDNKVDAKHKFLVTSLYDSSLSIQEDSSSSSSSDDDSSSSSSDDEKEQPS